jgi:cytochrome c-type biogenesis protein CcmH/NrfG
MRRLLLLACCLGLAFSLPLAHAAGGGGGGGGGGDDDSAPARVVNDPDYKAAMDAVRTSDWDQVIKRMNLYVARNPGDADGWNELGHAYRKAGDLDAAFKSYEKALAIDPGHRNAHEYLGEAYLQAGDLAKAEAELRVLDKLCFLPCEQYSDLKQEIARFKRDHPSLATR